VLLVLLIGAAGMVAALISLKMLIGERNRDRALISSARRAGLSFSHEDPFDCAGPPFDLFREGDGRGVQNVMWKPNAEHPIRVFDYWWYDEYEDQNGVVHRSYHRRTVATAEVGWLWPQLSLTREGIISKAASVLGARDLEFESEEFNRTFFVTCEDRRFANTFLDAQMIDLLAATKGLVEMEVKSKWIVLYTKRLKGEEFPPLYRLTETIVARIPQLVFEMWPR
jgi:hypothetical protein